MKNKKTTIFFLMTGLTFCSLALAQDNSSFYQMFDNYQKKESKNNSEQFNNRLEETIIIDKQPKSKNTASNMQNTAPKSCFDYNSQPIDYNTAETTLNNISFNIPTTQWNDSELFTININPKNHNIKNIKAILFQGRKSINIPDTYWDEPNNKLLLFPLSTQPLYNNVYSGNANLQIYIENEKNEILNKQMSIKINKSKRNINKISQMRAYKNSINNYQNKLSSYCN